MPSPEIPTREHGRRSAGRVRAPRRMPPLAAKRAAQAGPASAAAPRTAGRPRWIPRIHLSVRSRIGIGVTALALIAGISLPATGGPAQASEPTLQELLASEAQSLTVSAHVKTASLDHDDVSATDLIDTLVTSGTNADWAQLVLLDGKWPVTEQNITVILRWMRQENGPPNWFNRNNPLNNGYGSGGGAGLGSYPSLQSAAFYAAANLHRGYPAVSAALSAGDSADAVAAAIWASPWSSSHYANGSHWSSAPVEIVKAPAADW